VKGKLFCCLKDLIAIFPKGGTATAREALGAVSHCCLEE
jgi:hypothetical protein